MSGDAEPDAPPPPRRPGDSSLQQVRRLDEGVWTGVLLLFWVAVAGGFWWIDEPAAALWFGGFGVFIVAARIGRAYAGRPRIAGRRRD